MNLLDFHMEMGIFKENKIMRHAAKKQSVSEKLGQCKANANVV